MKRSIKRRLTVAAASSFALLTIGATPAFAINEIHPVECMFSFGERYFKVNSTQITGGTVTARCFANAGEMNIKQNYVVSYIAGNNAGWFVYAPGDGSEYRHNFNKGDSIHAGDWGTIYELHIN